MSNKREDYFNKFHKGRKTLTKMEILRNLIRSFKIYVIEPYFKSRKK